MEKSKIKKENENNQKGKKKKKGKNQRKLIENNEFRYAIRASSTKDEVQMRRRK